MAEFISYEKFVQIKASNRFLKIENMFSFKMLWLHWNAATLSVPKRPRLRRNIECCVLLSNIARILLSSVSVSSSCLDFSLV